MFIVMTHMCGYGSGGQINTHSIDITSTTISGVETETNAWFSTERPKSQVRTETKISTFLVVFFFF